MRTFLALLLVTGCSNAGPAPAASNTAAPATQSGAASAELKEGDAAPNVTLVLTDGSKVELKSLVGKQVLVYFYPKDDTPGCTIEAQGIRDAKADLEAAGVSAFGVSTQDATSHAAFIEKHQLNFPLVVDDKGEIARAFNVPVKGEYAARQSFLIGKDGRIKKVWRQVTPADHAANVIAAAKE
jgi:thioredoxin-dependent peroxiredoxin